MHEELQMSIGPNHIPFRILNTSHDSPPQNQHLKLVNEPGCLGYRHLEVNIHYSSQRVRPPYIHIPLCRQNI
jgi:hypothetical protein